MKTKSIKIVCVMFCLALPYFTYATEYNLNQTDGTISILNSAYQSGMSESWNINTGVNKTILFNYSIDLEVDCECDNVKIYNVDASGAETLLAEFYGITNGCIITTVPSGRARVVFTSYPNGYLWDSTGFNLTFSVNNSTSLEDNLYVEQRLGVGTTTPRERLDVNGNAIIDGSLSVKNQFIYNTSSTIGLYSYTNYSSLSSTYGLYSNTNNSGGGTTYGIYSSVAGASSAQKWSGYFTGGDVCVNNANIIANDMILGRNAKQFIVHTQSHKPNDPPVLYIAPKLANSWDWTKQIVIKHDGTFALTGGSLGLGTTNPLQKLDVRGSVYCKIPASGDTIKGFTLGVESFSNQANAARSYFLKITDLGSPSTSFIVKGNGNVGIGTLVPQYKLDVLGTIRAREIIVDLNGTSGADYVFAPDYKLRPLHEVSTFVNENRHLPDVPSEIEMQTNGLSMHEFQITLLQKVEELTLYLIEQDKTIKVLNEKIQQLENK